MSESTLDWSVTRRRLATARTQIESTLYDDGADLDAVLRERAQRLAQRGRGGKRARTNGTEMLAFRLGEERYALRLQSIVRVLSFDACVPIPCASPDLVAIVNVRGDILSVMDLASLLGLSPSRNSMHYVLLTRLGQRTVGLRVDRLDEVVRVETDPLMERSESDGEALSEYVERVFGDSLILLNASALARHPSLNVQKL